MASFGARWGPPWNGSLLAGRERLSAAHPPCPSTGGLPPPIALGGPVSRPAGGRALELPPLARGPFTLQPSADGRGPSGAFRTEAAAASFRPLSVTPRWRPVRPLFLSEACSLPRGAACHIDRCLQWSARGHAARRQLPHGAAAAPLSVAPRWRPACPSPIAAPTGRCRDIRPLRCRPLSLEGAPSTPSHLLNFDRFSSIWAFILGSGCSMHART